MNRLPRIGRTDLGSSGRRPSANQRRVRMLRPLLEDLENRTVLSTTITWNTTAAPTGGDYDLGSNWNGGVVPSSSDIAEITGLTGAGTVELESGNADSVGGLITDSTVTLEVTNDGSLSLGSGSSSTLGGMVYVDQGSALNVGSGASVTIGAAQTLYVYGSLTFANGDAVSFSTSNSATTQIVVNGTMTATGTTFANANSASGSVSQIYAGTGGELKATSSTFGLNQLYFSSGSVVNSADLSSNVFNLPIYVPAVDASLLAQNESFEAVYILGGTLTSGQSATLNPMGTQTTVGQYYEVPSGLTVASGATLTIGTGAAVAIADTQVISVSGTLTVTGATVYFANTSGYGSNYSDGITLNNGGTMTASDSTFTQRTGGSENTNIQVSTGGQIAASNSTFSLANFYLNSGSVFGSGGLSNNIFETTLTVPVSDVPLLTSNQSFNAVYLTGELTSGQSVTLNPMGTETTVGQFYQVPSGLTVASGATLTIGTGAVAAIPDTEVISVSGTLTVTGATVYFANTSGYGSNYSDGITLNNGGTMTASDSTFTQRTGGSENTNIQVSTGGQIAASNSTFSLANFYLNSGSVFGSGGLSNNIFETTLTVPVSDVPLLTSNQSFNAVYLTGELTSGQSVTLNPMGTETTVGQFYQVPSGLTVASGATLTIGTGAAVAIADTQVISVSGTLTVTGATVYFANTSGYGSNYSDGITLNNGGTMTASDSTFTQRTGGSENTNIQVSTGGQIAASNSTFSLANFYLNSGSVFGSGGLSNNIFETTLTVPVSDVPLLTSNQSFNAVYLTGELTSGQSVTLNPMGTETTVGQFYQVPSGLTVASGATLTIGTGAVAAIPDTEVISVSGTLTVTGATVYFANTSGYGSNYSDGITVNNGGTMTASDSTFTQRTGGSENTNIQVSTGGQIAASNSTFSLANFYLNSGSVFGSGGLSNNIFETTLTVPVSDVPLLTSNQSFNAVYLTGELTSGQSVTLNPMGTETTVGQFYQVPSGLTVASGATLTIGTGAVAAIPDTEVISVSGTLTVTGATVYFANTSGYGSNYSDGITLNNGGTMTASDSTFTQRTGGSENTNIQVSSGGSFSATGCTISLDNLIFDSGTTDTVERVDFTGTLSINSGANVGTTDAPTITGNNFSNVGNLGIVASGASNVTIPFSGNYWGVIEASQIQAKIEDSYENSNLPTVGFQPWVSNASGTSAVPASAMFSPTDQTINLSATVSTSPAGVGINGGTETFTILYGTEVIGEPTSPAQVSDGSVTAQYTLPGETPAGQYMIEASYSGYTNPTTGASYLPALDTSHLLTVSAAGTDTTVGNASATFSDVEDQSINLSARVSSSAGTVNEGTVTFTILSSGTPVGSPLSSSVVNDAASATYDLLAGTPGGDYTIEAVYTDPDDFTTSTGTNTLTVTAAPTTITPLNATATFSTATGEGTFLAADVTSSTAGTVDVGAVTFTILNSSTEVVPPFSVDVENGIASENYILPAGTAVGSYTIEAVYDGTSTFAESLPSSSTLTISAAMTTTTASNASTQFSETAQSVSLTATVTSPAGTVNAGSVIFTIMNGATTIGSPVSANVSAGSASASYTLPPGQALGIYTIDADYNGNTDFEASADDLHSLTISQPPVSQLVIETPPSPMATAGQTFAVQPVIYAENQYGDVVTSDNTTVVTVSLASGIGPLQGTATATVKNGVATFTNLGDNTAESITLEFSAPGNIAPAVSGAITISPAAASKLVIAIQPYPSVTAGNPLTDPIVVDEEDRYGNVETGDNSTVVTASVSSGAGTLEGTMTATVVNGVASFDDLEDNTAGALTLQFAAPNLPAAISDPSVVSPAAASSLTVNRPPGGVTAGTAFSLEVDAYDPYGNLATSFDSAVTVGVASGSGTLSGTVTTDAVGGVATFNDLVSTTSGSISLSASSETLPSSPPTQPIVVTPASAIAPTVVLEIIMTTQKHNKKGKPVGKPVFNGFVLKYSETMNAATADSKADYQVFSKVVKSGKKSGGTSLKPVAFSVYYSAASDEVMIEVSSSKPFAKGGEITIGAVTSQAGVLISASDTTFTVQPNAKGIALD